jgi:hypothetical protein
MNKVKNEKEIYHTVAYNTMAKRIRTKLTNNGLQNNTQKTKDLPVPNQKSERACICVFLASF